jgi:hypothetical protein
MSFEKPHHDVERGTLQVPSFMTPSEKFLLFRDAAFVCIILLHLGTTLLAIPTLSTHSAAPDSRAYLAVIIFLGVFVPIMATLGYRDQLPTSKVTSAIWFELGWCTVVLVIDSVVAIAQSSIGDASKTAVALTWLQTVAVIVYTLGLSAAVLLQHKMFDVPVWKLSVQSVQWLRSPEPIHHSQPPSPSFFASAGSPKIRPPWDTVNSPDMEEVKLDEPIYVQKAVLPEPTYIGAHPFWQAHVKRQVAVDDDMAYVIRRYGLNIEAEKRLSNKPNGSKHAKKPSIRDLGISRPVPVESTIRRANTLAGSTAEAHRNFGHQRGGSLQHSRAVPTLRLDIPKSDLDVPVDVIAIPEPAATKTIHFDNHSRSLGLAGRTLIGAGRPKASASRQHNISSKPLPSPPAFDDSDESMRSLTSAQGSHSFVMAMAHRVQISASKVRPLMISTPKAAETPIDHESNLSW